MRVLNYAAQSYSALERNQAHSFAAEHALRIFSSNAIYSFIPKNACSTLRLSLALANGCIDDTADFVWIHNNNQTFTADLPSLITADYTFVVLRCPFARLASVYLDKIVGRDLDAWWLYDALRRKIPVESITFEQFILALSERKIREGNIHWRPQVDFLVYKQYDDYFCLEAFPLAIATLKSKINLTVVDARSLTAHGIESMVLIETGDNFATLGPDDIRALKATGRCPSPRSLYTPDLIDLVRQLYRQDIELYTQHFGVENLMFV